MHTAAGDVGADLIVGAHTDHDIEKELGWLFQDVHRLLSRRFDQKVRATGLTRAQWRIITNVLRHDGLTQTELADILEVEKAPLGRMLDKMEEAGWISRLPDDTDRRVRRVHVSDKVAPCLPVLGTAVAELFDEALVDMSETDIKALARYLSHIKTNLAATLGLPRRSAGLKG